MVLSLTGASPFGRGTCKYADFHCDCPRKFSDPNAAWGWSSHNERYFYGYMGYFISMYNRTEKSALPLYLRILDTQLANLYASCCFNFVSTFGLFSPAAY